MRDLRATYLPPPRKQVCTVYSSNGSTTRSSLILFGLSQNAIDGLDSWQFVCDGSKVIIEDSSANNVECDAAKKFFHVSYLPIG
jgi:hypothetical protein